MFWHVAPSQVSLTNPLLSRKSGSYTFYNLGAADPSSSTLGSKCAISQVSSACKDPPTLLPLSELVACFALLKSDLLCCVFQLSAKSPEHANRERFASFNLSSSILSPAYFILLPTGSCLLRIAAPNCLPRLFRCLPFRCVCLVASAVIIACPQTGAHEWRRDYDVWRHRLSRHKRRCWLGKR